MRVMTQRQTFQGDSFFMIYDALQHLFVSQVLDLQKYVS